MTKTSLQMTLMAVILVIAQAVVFNNVCLFNVAVPMVFIWVLIKLPITLHSNWLLTVGFFLGLAVDMFSDTYGMNAMACTLTAMLRPVVLRLYVSRGDELPNPVPSALTLGQGTFMKYLWTITLLYCLFISLIEAFTFFNLGFTLVRIVASTLLSGLLVMAIDVLTVTHHRHREKRL